MRVSQPLCPSATVTSSDHACPNCEREYPVFGARPFTWRVSSVVHALEAATCEGAAGAGAAQAVPASAAGSTVPATATVTATGHTKSIRREPRLFSMSETYQAPPTIFVVRGNSYAGEGRGECAQRDSNP